MAWQIIGFVSYFEITHYFLKKEIKLLLKHGVPKDELVIFEFDKNEMNQLVWLKKNEFDLNGNLFDVVRRHVKNNGKTYMECISDEKETELFFQLEHGITSNMGNDENPTPLSNWFKILNFPLIEPSESFEIAFYTTSESNKDFFKYKVKASTEVSRIDSPPPRFS
jgi:hypothetical protein